MKHLETFLRFLTDRINPDPPNKGKFFTPKKKMAWEKSFYSLQYLMGTHQGPRKGCYFLHTPLVFFSHFTRWRVLLLDVAPRFFTTAFAWQPGTTFRFTSSGCFLSIGISGWEWKCHAQWSLGYCYWLWELFKHPVIFPNVDLVESVFFESGDALEGVVCVIQVWDDGSQKATASWGSKFPLSIQRSITYQVV